MQNAAKRLPGLDALRGLAALLVVVGHCFLARDGAEQGRPWIAVDVFFALSGYVMARTYEGRLAEGMSGLAFLRARIRRLWPVLAIGATLGYLLLAPTTGLSRYFMMLLWLPVPVLALAPFPLNGPQWSVVIELAVNALHVIVRRLGVIGLLALSFAAYVAMLAWAPHWHSGTLTGDFLWAVPRALCTYCLGIVLYRHFRDAPALPFWPVLLLPALLLVSPPDWLIAPLAMTILVCALSNPPAMLLRPLVWLGDLSFPLYAIHSPIVLAIHKAALPVWLAIPVSVAAAHLMVAFGGSRLTIRNLRPLFPKTV
ncbi:peptidoglycan/LPS O-acetylase OafA/YrhL [Novosphingobium kunmingense]|uniref:Peptidoglycan/LPS O-acetylase OafA/YrhL n=1 Tax=Novosphingobium kunmingense TaxID=1211806 RepID=A0A2N0I268_9SPHN|nr:acyltransferase [Novosphingobium kunmingense]PKB25278.1 peptidoglycan/LPS O-acetylase OafA/YrhL [Novosphingobium kunmingense]